MMYYFIFKIDKENVLIFTGGKNGVWLLERTIFNHDKSLELRKMAFLKFVAFNLIVISEYVESPCTWIVTFQIVKASTHDHMVLAWRGLINSGCSVLIYSRRLKRRLQINRATSIGNGMFCFVPIKLIF